MTKVKAWRVLLIMMLALASTVLFACKETEVKVDSITFSDKSINLLVGETYAPEIKILPSYAANRSYTLISGDTTKLTVDGGVIYAIGAGRGIKLKVVSNENEKLNDMIVVNIYNEPEQLAKPQNLEFDGKNFTFEGVNNASSYLLKVGDTEINIGNNVQYSFDRVAEICGQGVYGQALECSVQAVGDGRIYQASVESESINITKLPAISNSYVANEILYINPIVGVEEYTAEIFKNGLLHDTKTINATNLSQGLISFDVSDLSLDTAGANYTIKVNAVADETSVFSSNAFEFEYKVVGQAVNLTLNNFVLSWDLVENATKYQVELYKNNSHITTFSNITINRLELTDLDAGNYYCKVLAQNNASQNVTAGKVYSSNLEFKILSVPTLSASNKALNWNAVDGAEGYILNIRLADGTHIIKDQFVVGNSYDVSTFSANTYYADIIASGNSSGVLSSKPSTPCQWIVLNKLQNVRVENNKIYWKDIDASSLEKYKLEFDIDGTLNENLILTNAQLNSQYTFDATTGEYSYSLSGYDFAVGAHAIKLQSIGANNVFDAEINNTDLFKLGNSSITSIQNKVLSFNAVEKAVDYEIEIYAKSDTNFETPLISERIATTSYIINDSELNAGEYVARVYVYGNGGKIFDADLPSAEQKLEFSKLDIPKLEESATDLTVKIVDAVEGVTYKLYQNNILVALDADNKYSLNAISAGDYSYTAQAIGNGTNVLDSNRTQENDEIIVKKLHTPALSFDKSTLTYTVTNVSDAEFVAGYDFDINGTKISVNKTTGKADCSSVVTTATNYAVKVTALPATKAGYDLIIASNVATDSFEKLAGECTVKVDNGKLVIEPKTALTGNGYSLELTVTNSTSEKLVITDASYISNRFEINLYDANYNIYEFKNGDDVQFFRLGEQYSFETKILNDDNDIVQSEKVASESTITVLNGINDIRRQAQSIEFNNVANAGYYIMNVLQNGRTWKLDLSGKYNTATNNLITMEVLLQLMNEYGIPYIEGEPYQIDIVSMPNSNQYVPARCGEKFIFEFLPAPTISIEENGNDKILTVLNDNANVSVYSVEFSQGQTKKTLSMSADGEYSTYNLANLSQFGAGEVQIKVKARASSGNYFESEYSTLSAHKLSSSTLSVENGVLKWTEVANAKQYNLHYVQLGQDNVISLTEGAEGFTVQNGVCSYEFESMPAGNASLYLQVDGVVAPTGKYINSNNSDSINVYKLATPNVSVVNGEICVEMTTADFLLKYDIDARVDGATINLEQMVDNGDAEIEYGLEMLKATINPASILKYISTTELTAENITIKVYTQETNKLNSSTGTKDVYGLLKPENVAITTSSTVDETTKAVTEVLEKITWTNPSVNGAHVDRYIVEINYEGEPYKFVSTATEFIMPKYYDADNNGTFDEDNGDVKFGAGEYRIKVVAITDNDDNIVNSQFSDEIAITILATPEDIKTTNGNIEWKQDINVEYYLIKVYLLDKEGNKTIVASTTTNGKTNKFDLCDIDPVKVGVYGITLQAMHTNKNILVSEESEMLEVVRLPQAQGYYIDDGRLGIRAHKFYTKAEIYLIDAKTNKIKLPYEITNKNLDSADDATDYQSFVDNMTSWSTSNIIETYSLDEYYVDELYSNKDLDYTLRQALAEGYKINIRLIGNSCSGKGAIVSGYTLLDAENLNITTENIVKLATPVLSISETTRGQVDMGLPNNVKYTLLNYHSIGNTALKGVHLYNVSIKTDRGHSFYVAEIIDKTQFNECNISIEEDKNNDITYFVHNGLYFNVLESLSFNLNQAGYGYYSHSGTYTNIDLSKGGSFVVNARLMGDDTYFAQSDMSDSAIVKRYDVLTMSVKNGALTWKNEADEYDNPIYMLDLNTDNSKYTLILFDKNSYTQEQIAEVVDPENKLGYIYEGITYTLQDESITFNTLADVINRCTGNVLGGTFTANIKTYYSTSKTNDKILASSTVPASVTVLPQAQLGLTGGELSWNMISLQKGDGEPEYIKDYLLQILDTQGEILYDVILAEGGYKVSNYKASYELPMGYGEDFKDFAFVSGQNYKFSLTALGGSSTTYVNSLKHTIDETQLLPMLTEVKMSSGVLTWNNPTTRSVYIVVTYKLGNTEVVYTHTTSNNSFDLPKGLIMDQTGTTQLLTTGNDYYIKVRLHGGADSLNSFYAELSEPSDDEPLKYTRRLPTVIGLTTDSGVLTWDVSEVADTKYIVHYSYKVGEDTFTGKTELLDENRYDFAGLKHNGEYIIGSISATVEAWNDRYFSSHESDMIELYKPSIPTNIIFNEGTNTISWDSVKDAQGEDIDTYKIKIIQEGEGGVTETEYDHSLKNNGSSWTIQEAGTSFKISVKAVSKQTDDRIINGEYSEPVSMEAPNPINRETFIYNQELQRFEWNEIKDQQTADEHYLVYDYASTLDANASPSYATIEQKISTYEVVTQQNDEGETVEIKKYYFYPTAVGTYINIYVQVKRLGTLASNPIYCWDAENNITYTLKFNLFASGNGGEKPYIITSEEHLRNIGKYNPYFLQANYVLAQGIKLTSSEPITSEEQVFTGNITADTSKGEIAISNYTSTGDATGVLPDYVGLFNKVSGATFSDFKLAGFNMNGKLKSDKLYMGLLAGYAENAKFTNVQVVSSNISVSKKEERGDNNYSVYIGSLVGLGVNTYITSCSVTITGKDKFNLHFAGDSNSLISVGGFVGQLQGGKISDSNNIETDANFNITYQLSYNTYSPVLYLGAIAGTIDGATIDQSVSGQYNNYANNGQATTNTNLVGSEIN